MFDVLYIKFFTNLGILQPFEPNPNIVVALSGGVDSMSVLLLTKRWLDQIGGNLTAITVNHNLRPSSAQEAKLVSLICQKLNIKHVILDWLHDDLDSNVQAKARDARYQLMSKYCQSHDIIHIFTGHHLDDDIENFFIKISRGSGIFALMQTKQSFINNIRICRPIFNFTKNQCMQILQHQKVAHVEDESNFTTDYFRNQLRFNLEKFWNFTSLSTDLFKQRIITSQVAMQSSAKHTQDLVISAMSECVSIFNAGFIKIKVDYLLKYTTDIQRYLLTYLLIICGASKDSPRVRSIDNILIELNLKNFSTATLNKCIINFIEANNTLIIYKERSSITMNSVLLNNNDFWDNRFRILLKCKQDDLSVCALDLNSYKKIKDNINYKLIDDAHKHKHKILFTLPVIKRLEKIVSIPNIDYYDGLCKDDIMSFFEPSYISKIIHINI